MRLASALRLVLAGSAIGLVPAGALAQVRPDSRVLTCQAAKDLVTRNGALVVGTGPFIYDRFVVSRAFCQPTQSTRPGFVETRDNSQCFIGYVCGDFSFPSSR